MYTIIAQVRDLKVGDRFGYGGTVAIVVLPWSYTDRTLAYRLEDRESVFKIELKGSVQVDLELVPGTPDYYRAVLREQDFTTLVATFEADAKRAVTAPFGSDAWETARGMLDISRAEILRRLG